MGDQNQSYHEVRWDKESNSRADVFLIPSEGIIRKVRAKRTKDSMLRDCFGTLFLGELAKAYNDLLRNSDLKFYVPEIISASFEYGGRRWGTSEVMQHFCIGTPLNLPSQVPERGYSVIGEESTLAQRVNYLCGAFGHMMEREGFIHGDAGARHFFLLPHEGAIRFFDRAGKPYVESPENGLATIDLEDSFLGKPYGVEVQKDQANFMSGIKEHYGLDTTYLGLGADVVREAMGDLGPLTPAYRLAVKKFEEAHMCAVPEQFER